jgi:hypothetical protein
MKNSNFVQSRKSVLISFFCFSLLIMIPAITFAADPPVFSGSWKLNNSLSTLQADFSFAPQTIKIVQDANTLIVEKVMNMMGETSTTNAKYTLDGVECKNPGFMDSQTSSKALWNETKTSLGIKSVTDMQGQSMESTETYSITKGQLKIDYSMNSPMGQITESYVFDKQ